MKVNKFLLLVLLIGLLASTGMLAAIVCAESSKAPAPPGNPPAPAAAATTAVVRTGDEEMAHLLVRLMLKTRGVIAEHHTSSQSAVPGISTLYQRWLTKNGILPAAVAGRIFAETVPEATGSRAWVKMVVAEPRNENNRGDATALEMLEELRGGAKTSLRSTAAALYYGEPIVAKQWCLRCHGEPRGAPDPSFPEFVKDGWKENEVIGGVIARVAPPLVLPAR